MNKTFLQMMERLGYDVELTYSRREEQVDFVELAEVFEEVFYADGYQKINRRGHRL